MTLESDIDCRHVFVSLTEGYEDGWNWCRKCGTLEYTAVSMDPYVETTEGRMVPKLARGFVEIGEGV